MVAGIIVANVLLIVLLVSVGLLIRDVRRLHHSGRSLTDSPGEAGGVTAAGMAGIGNNMTH
jgi:hypothetical protein